MIHYRHLEQTDLAGLARIDRSDYSSTWCIVKKGVLVHEEREFRHPGFSQSRWDQIVKEFTNELIRGKRMLIGAFENEILIGVAGLDVSQRYGCNGDMYNFGPIWISTKYRGRGVGKRLFALIVKEAESLDVCGLYVSATPVPNTVKFYMKMGCQLLRYPDPRLFDEEPEDIHMYICLPNKAEHQKC